MQTLQRLAFAWFLVFQLLVTACAAIIPKSFDQSLALGYATQTTVLDSAKIALARKQITVDDAKAVLEASDSAGQFLDAATAVKDTDVSSAQASLDLATKLLDQLIEYLQERDK